MKHSDEAKPKAEGNHVPVMLDEVLHHLNPQEGQTIVDATLGLGGHTSVLLKHLGSEGRLIGIDRDAKALELARANLAGCEGRCDLVRENFRNLDKVLTGLHVEAVDGILLDLGISSAQLNDPERGFGFRFEGPLDMRMNQQSHITAFDLINGLSEQEIAHILRDFGQERMHRRIARRIVAARSEKPIETTNELSRIVVRAMPRGRKWTKIHPSTRTFQAIRIAVNRELEGLEVVLDQCSAYLKTGGRIAVIAFHSLEDRIVKQKFKALAQAGRLKVITKKPLRPGAAETDQNPRARSARLRIAERI